MNNIEYYEIIRKLSNMIISQCSGRQIQVKVQNTKEPIMYRLMSPGGNMVFPEFMKYAAMKDVFLMMPHKDYPFVPCILIVPNVEQQEVTVVLPNIPKLTVEYKSGIRLDHIAEVVTAMFGKLYYMKVDGVILLDTAHQLSIPPTNYHDIDCLDISSLNLLHSNLANVLAYDSYMLLDAKNLILGGNYNYVKCKSEYNILRDYNDYRIRIRKDLTGGSSMHTDNQVSGILSALGQQDNRPVVASGYKTISEKIMEYMENHVKYINQPERMFNDFYDMGVSCYYENMQTFQTFVKYLDKVGGLRVKGYKILEETITAKFYSVAQTGGFIQRVKTNKGDAIIIAPKPKVNDMAQLNNAVVCGYVWYVEDLFSSCDMDVRFTWVEGTGIKCGLASEVVVAVQPVKQAKQTKVSTKQSIPQNTPKKSMSKFFGRFSSASGRMGGY